MVTLLHLISVGPIALSFMNRSSSSKSVYFVVLPVTVVRVTTAFLGGAAIRVLLLSCKLLAFHGPSRWSAESISSLNVANLASMNPNRTYLLTCCCRGEIATLFCILHDLSREVDRVTVS